MPYNLSKRGIEKYIELGYSVCMLPDTIMKKDINERDIKQKRNNDLSFIKENIVKYT